MGDQYPIRPIKKKSKYVIIYQTELNKGFSLSSSQLRPRDFWNFSVSEKEKVLQYKDGW